MPKPNEEAIIIKVAMFFNAINAGDLVETEAKAADLVSACNEHGGEHAALMRTLISRLTLYRALHPANGSIVTLSVAGKQTKHAQTGDTVVFVEMQQAGVTYGQYAVFGDVADLILAAIAKDAASTFVVVKISAPTKIGQSPRAVVSLA